MPDATASMREIGADQFDLVWPIVQAVVAAGDTYAYPRGLDLEQARSMWATPPARCFVASDADAVLGCYRISPNQLPGSGGDHVANGSYMVAPEARGRGIASQLCAHSLEQARRAGFTAMQFNFVVASNAPAVHLWKKHGFMIVGMLPGAFRHPELGLVDAYVMFRKL